MTKIVAINAKHLITFCGSQGDGRILRVGIDNEDLTARESLLS